MKLNIIIIIMNSEHSEFYSDPFDRFIKGWQKFEDLYGQESCHSMDKKNDSPNSGIDNVSLNDEIQKNSEKNNIGNVQAPNSNNVQLSNNINFQIPNEGNALFSINQIIKEKDDQSSAPQLLNKNEVQSPFNDNNKQPINFNSKNNSNGKDQHQEKYPIYKT